MSLEEDREENAEDLARRGDRAENQRVKVGDRVKDEGLPHGAAHGKSRNLAHDLGVGHQKGTPGGDLTESAGNDYGRQAHKEVRPEHEIVGLGLDTDLGGFCFESFLESRGDAIENEGHDDVKDSHEAVVTAGSLLLSHGYNGSSTNDRRNLQVLPEGIGRPSQEEGAGHDRGHLTALGEGGDGEAESVGQGQTGASLGGNLGSPTDSEHAEGNTLGGSGELHSEETDDDVRQGLQDLEEPCLFERGPVDGGDVSEDIFLEGTVIQKGGVDTASPDHELHAVG